MKSQIFRMPVSIFFISILLMLIFTTITYGKNEQDDTSVKLMNEMNKFINEVPFMANSGSSEIEKAYKQYEIVNHDIVMMYREKGSIEAIISEDYAWMVPTKNNFLTKVIFKDGEWKAIGAADYSDYSEEIFQSVIMDKTVVDQIIDDELRDAKIETIKFLDVGMFHLEFVFIQADGVEYLIPYNVSNNWINLERRLYKVDEFDVIMEVIYDHFGVENWVYDENGNNWHNGGGNDGRIFPAELGLESAAAEAAKIIPATDESVTLFQKISIMVMGAALVGVVILFAVKYKGGKKS